VLRCNSLEEVYVLIIVVSFFFFLGERSNIVRIEMSCELCDATLTFRRILWVKIDLALMCLM